MRPIINGLQTQTLPQIDAYPGQAIYIHIQDRKKEVKEFTLPASLESTENSASIPVTEPDILPVKKRKNAGKEKKVQERNGE